MHVYETRKTRFFFWDTENLDSFPHLHKEIEVLYVVEGPFTIQYDFQEYTLESGDFFIAFPNTIHEYPKDQVNKVLLWIFDASLLPDFAQIFRTKTPLLPIVHKEHQTLDTDYVISAFRNRPDLTKESPQSKAFLSLMAYDLLHALTLCDIGLHENYEWLMNLLVYLGDHLQDDLSLDTISEEIGISKYHLSRTFKARIGYSIPTYVNMMRIDQAIEYIKYSDKPITDIAFECGFESITTFFRVFKQITGTSPKRFSQK